MPIELNPCERWSGYVVHGMKRRQLKGGSQMSEERKPVLCPWCGNTMALDPPTKEAGGWASDGYGCAVCGSSTGGVYCCETEKQCQESAYKYATMRPPNLPLKKLD